MQFHDVKTTLIFYVCLYLLFLHKLLRKSQPYLGVVGKGRGEKLDTGFSHRSCSRNDIFCVQPNVLDPSGSVLLQEGVHLVSA